MEDFVLGGSVRAPNRISGSGTTQAQDSLIAITTTYNPMLRYPGETIRPTSVLELGLQPGSSTMPTSRAGTLVSLDIRDRFFVCHPEPW